MAEVGSWLGLGSTQVFIRELKREGKVVCVDTFRGSENVADHKQIGKDFDVLSTFLQNIKRSQVVDIRALDAVEAARQEKDASFDLVFIDSDHSYDATIAHVRAWLPKVKRGGIISGHDCEGHAKYFDRELLWAHRNDDHIRDPRGQFEVIHCGCILAVDEIFDGKANLAAGRRVRLSQGRSDFSTIWHATV